MILKIMMLYVILNPLSLYATEFPLSTKIRDQIAPRISGGNNNLLVVWEDYRNLTNGADIWGQFMDLSGNLIDTNFIIYGQPSYNQTAPSVKWGDSLYMVVWRQGIGGGQFHIYGQLVNPAGSIIGSAIPISTKANCEQPAIEFGDNHWLVVWADFRNTSNLDIYGQIMDNDGNPVDTAFQISNEANHQLAPALSWVKSKKAWLVVWEDNRAANADIWAQFVDTSGTLIGNNFNVSNAAENQRSPSVASNDTSSLVIWADFRNGNFYDLYAQYVDTSGTLINTNFVVAETSGCDLYYPQLIWNGSRFIAVWVRYNKIVTDNTMISNSTNDAWSPGLAKLGNDCIVVWQDNRNTLWDIYANIFTPAAVEEKINTQYMNSKINLEVYPNPFNTTTAINYYCPSNLQNRQNKNALQIYDVTGKLIKNLSTKQICDNLANIQWDGKDNKGKSVMPGVYFCILKYDNQKVIKKLIRI